LSREKDDSSISQQAKTSVAVRRKVKDLGLNVLTVEKSLADSHL